MSCGMTDNRSQPDEVVAANKTSALYDQETVEAARPDLVKSLGAIRGANAKQVGGKHYQKGKVQHWDFIADHNIGYLEGVASKYPTRHLDKNGVQDLEKAKHYVEKIIEKATTQGYQNTSTAAPDEVLAWCRDASLGPIETIVVYHILTWGPVISSPRATPPQLTIALSMLDQLIEETRGVQAQEARRSMYGIPASQRLDMGSAAKHEPRGFDAKSEQRFICDVVGGEDRPAEKGDKVVVSAPGILEIHGKSAKVVRVMDGGLWLEVKFDGVPEHYPNGYQCQYKDVTIILGA